MKRSLMAMRGFLSGAALLTLGLPVSASAGTVTIVSDTTWKVFDANKQWVGFAQSVCLNPTSPSNCPLGATPPPTQYGYPLGGWTADLSSIPTAARWIWAPNITGASSPAASQSFTFEKEFYVCNPPAGGTVSVAVDDSAEVWLNGTLVPSSASTGHSAFKTFSIPASSLYGASLLNRLPNVLTVKASNAPNPADCGSDQYKCNPAGVILGASFEFSGDPTCPGLKGGTYRHEQVETLASCPAGSTDVSHTCLCGFWSPDTTCPLEPPTCPGKDRSYGVNERETIPCPADAPVGSASHRCLATGLWESPDNSQCKPAPRTCPGKGGAVFNVGQEEDLGPCDAPRVGSTSRKCKSDGTWADIVDTCRLPEVCVGAPPGTCICGSRDGQTGTCPTGVDCGPYRHGDPLHPLVTTDWYCGTPPPTALGEPCTWNLRCGSRYCDRGNNTSQTGLCMPSLASGSTGDWCSNNNQCASARCGGLRQDASGAWHPGHCATNTPSALGEFCSFNSDCTSTYCDRGNGTSKTSMCMPRGSSGGTGDWCSHHNQCSSRECAGLQPRADGSWQPGHCN